MGFPNATTPAESEPKQQGPWEAPPPPPESAPFDAYAGEDKGIRGLIEVQRLHPVKWEGQRIAGMLPSVPNVPNWQEIVRDRYGGGSYLCRSLGPNGETIKHTLELGGDPIVDDDDGPADQGQAVQYVYVDPHTGQPMLDPYGQPAGPPPGYPQPGGWPAGPMQMPYPQWQQRQLHPGFYSGVASPVETDRLRQELSELKDRHYKELSELKDRHREAVDQLRREHERTVDQMREDHGRRVDDLRERVRSLELSERDAKMRAEFGGSNKQDQTMATIMKVMGEGSKQIAQMAEAMLGRQESMSDVIKAIHAMKPGSKVGEVKEIVELVAAVTGLGKEDSDSWTALAGKALDRVGGIVEKHQEVAKAQAEAVNAPIDAEYRVVGDERPPAPPPPPPPEQQAPPPPTNGRVEQEDPVSASQRVYLTLIQRVNVYLKHRDTKDRPQLAAQDFVTWTRAQGPQYAEAMQALAGHTVEDLVTVLDGAYPVDAVTTLARRLRDEPGLSWGRKFLARLSELVQGGGADAGPPA